MKQQVRDRSKLLFISFQSFDNFLINVEFSRRRELFHEEWQIMDFDRKFEDKIGGECYFLI